MLFSILDPRATAYNILDHSERNWLPAYALTIQIVVTFLVWVRIISRLTTNGRAGFDDVLIFFAWILGTLMTAACILCMYTPRFDTTSTDRFSCASLWVQQAYMGSASQGLVERRIGMPS